jgi:NAD(P)-dependent dehydrogenase (short-subunit alcohol dehydrogenase family)
MTPPTSAPVAVLTGATRGIGYFTALGLLERGYEVVFLARSPTRGEEAARELLQDLDRTSAPGGDRAPPALHWVAADLSRTREVVGAARALAQRFPRIHLLLNNAAVAERKFQRTPEGIEVTLAVNHLAPVLLAHHLLPSLLEAGARGEDARLVNVSSNAHARRLDLTAFEGPKGYAGVHAYSQSKLLNLVHAFDLARRLEGTGVTANAVHPGLVGTGLLLEYLPPGVIQRVTGGLLRLFSLSPRQGARMPLLAATGPTLEGRSGVYLRKGRIQEPAPVARALDVHEGVRRWTRGLTGVDWAWPGAEPREEG